MTILKLAFIGSLRIVFMGSLKIALFLYAIFLSDTPSAGVPEGNGYVGDKEGAMPPCAERSGTIALRSGLPFAARLPKGESCRSARSGRDI